MIEIDGAYDEGGGQIVRTACSLAVLTKRACPRSERDRTGIKRGNPKNFVPGEEW